MKGSISLYLLLAMAAYAALAFALISSAGASAEKIRMQGQREEIAGKLSAACTSLELLSAGASSSAADYSFLQGVHFEGNKAVGYAQDGETSLNASRECLVSAGAGEILRVE